MALIKREQLTSLVEEVKSGKVARVYLIFGERYLCREAADGLEKAILESGGTCHAIDGDQEDPGKTLGQLLNFSLLPGRQLYRVTDSRLFHSKDVAFTIWQKAQQAHEAGKKRLALKHLLALSQLASLGPEDAFKEISPDQWQTLFGFVRPAGDLNWIDALLAEAPQSKRTTRGRLDVTEQYIEALKKGLPGQNTLLLLAENVDKRKKFFTFIKEQGQVIDCSVATGSGAAAKKDQARVLQTLVQKCLASFDKRIDGRALNALMERVGFHPVAVVTETEKLALYVGEQKTIQLEDLDAMVGRIRHLLDR